MRTFPPSRRWREVARQRGLGELFLLYVNVGQSMQGLDSAEEHRLDGSLDFSPHNMFWKGIDRHHLQMRHDFPATR